MTLTLEAPKMLSANQGDETGRKKVSAISKTAPSLPFEIWNIILDYAVADFNSGISYLSFRRENEEQSRRFKTITNNFIHRLMELCSVNRAFNASVKRQKAYNRIWEHLQILYPIHRVTYVTYDVCNCDRQCGGALCEGRWELHFDASIPENFGELERIVNNGEISAISSDFLRLLLLSDTFHFDSVVVRKGDHGYLLLPLAKKLGEHIALNPECICYTKMIFIADDMKTMDDEDDLLDEDYLLEALESISKDLRSIAANHEMRLNAEALRSCYKCGSFEIYVNTKLEPNDEDLCKDCLRDNESSEDEYPDDHYEDFFDDYDDLVDYLYHMNSCISHQ